MEDSKGSGPEDRGDRQLQIANIIVSSLDILMCLIVIALHFI